MGYDLIALLFAPFLVGGLGIAAVLFVDWLHAKHAGAVGAR